MFSSPLGANFALKLKKLIIMKTLPTIILFVLLAVAVHPLYAQEPPVQTPQPPEKEQVKEQTPPAKPQTPPETPEKTVEKEEVKQIAPNKPEQQERQQRLRQERGARPQIVRPGGRPAGAGRPQGARRPGRR